MNKPIDLPELKKSPITREQLRDYAVASGDHNPIHLDEAAAKKAGLPSVIAHGMLSMAFASEFLIQALENQGWNDGRIQKVNCRFRAMVFPGDQITVKGKGHLQNIDGVEQISCEFEAVSQKSETVISGKALLVRKNA